MKTITLKRENQMPLQFQGEKIASVDGPDIDETKEPDVDDPNYDPYPPSYNYTLYKTAHSVKSCNYVLYIVDTTFIIDIWEGTIETYQSLEELRENFLGRDNNEKKRGQPFTNWQKELLTQAGIRTVEILE